MNIYALPASMKTMMGKWLALILSVCLATISIGIMLTEGGTTPKVWALLLLTPAPIVFIISRKHSQAEEFQQISDDWEEEIEVNREGNVGDPTESGFDIPVL